MQERILEYSKTRKRRQVREKPVAVSLYDREALKSGEEDNLSLATESPLPEKTLPYNPIDSAMRTPEHARRTIQGILESYNSNYDALAEAIQNSMDALEDAFLDGLSGPYLLHITVNLKDMRIPGQGERDSGLKVNAVPG
jgi:hypothetical protein